LQHLRDFLIQWLKSPWSMRNLDKDVEAQFKRKRPSSARALYFR
jgi:hypothetical protein